MSRSRSQSCEQRIWGISQSRGSAQSRVCCATGERYSQAHLLRKSSSVNLRVVSPCDVKDGASEAELLWCARGGQVVQVHMLRWGKRRVSFWTAMNMSGVLPTLSHEPASSFDESVLWNARDETESAYGGRWISDPVSRCSL